MQIYGLVRGDKGSFRTGLSGAELSAAVAMPCLGTSRLVGPCLQRATRKKERLQGLRSASRSAAAARNVPAAHRSLKADKGRLSDRCLCLHNCRLTSPFAITTLWLCQHLFLRRAIVNQQQSELVSWHYFKTQRHYGGSSVTRGSWFYRRLVLAWLFSVCLNVCFRLVEYVRAKVCQKSVAMAMQCTVVDGHFVLFVWQSAVALAPPPEPIVTG